MSDEVRLPLCEMAKEKAAQWRATFSALEEKMSGETSQ
jgi:hypothetical protein